MEKTVLIVDDKSTPRDDVKWATRQSIPSAETIEAADKETALRLIQELREKIFAVICDGDLGDGNPFGGLDILHEAQSVGIKHLIFYSSIGGNVPKERKREGIYYTDDLEEVQRLLKEMGEADTSETRTL